MTYSSLARPAWLLAAAAALGACSGGTSSTSSGARSSRARPRHRPPPHGPPLVECRPASPPRWSPKATRCFTREAAGTATVPDAKGRTNGPDLTSGKFMHVNGSYEDFVRIITSGVPAEQIKDKTHTLAMNPRGGGRPPLLTDDQIKAVAAYVYSLNHK